MWEYILYGICLIVTGFCLGRDYERIKWLRVINRPSKDECLNPDYCGTADVESLCSVCERKSRG